MIGKPERIPDFYTPVSLRNVTPWDGDRVGVGLEADDGTTIRFSLAASDAAALTHLLRDPQTQRDRAVRSPRLRRF